MGPIASAAVQMRSNPVHKNRRVEEMKERPRTNLCSSRLLLLHLLVQVFFVLHTHKSNVDEAERSEATGSS